MIQSIDDVLRQARQGSVSAIIQVLNEKLADSGIRTRAILDDGILQLLCEADTPQQMEQDDLVPRIKRLLEGIGPRNIARVNINSRIVREQQLLWLQEIKRDPDQQLLWSQEIRLKQPSLLKRWQDDRQFAQADPMPLPKDLGEPKKKNSTSHFLRGLLVGSASLGMLLALVGWAMSDWLGIALPSFDNTASSDVSDRPSSPTPSPDPPAASPTPADPFVQAVRIAERAAIEGRQAETRAAWLNLASQWQEAADLMAKVPADDPRYATAQDRTRVYQENSRVAMEEAESLVSQEDAQAPPNAEE